MSVTLMPLERVRAPVREITFACIRCHFLQRVPDSGAFAFTCPAEKGGCGRREDPNASDDYLTTFDWGDYMSTEFHTIFSREMMSAANRRWWC